jgi:phosphoglycolate phosphatase-like HAD superfamily hydrolase
VSDAVAAAVEAADTVFYDFDGVLADSEPVHLRSYGEVIAARGGRLDEAAFRALIGRKEREIWPALTGEAAGVDELVDARAQRFLAIVERDGMPLDRRAADMLARGSGERVVLSSGNPAIVAPMLEAWGVVDRFSEVHALGDSPADKADELRRLVEERRARGAWRGVLVEDSPRMLRTGRALGLLTVGVVHSLNRREDVECADLVLEADA